MSALDGLLASSLYLAPSIRCPTHEAPEAVRTRSAVSTRVLRAQVLRSGIANAIEDLEDVEDLDDEVDRTMLLNTIRSDVLRLDAMAESSHANPVAPIGHAVLALRSLMIEHFAADDEAALRDRVTALPELLDAIAADPRPVEPHLLPCALELDARRPRRRGPRRPPTRRQVQPAIGPWRVSHLVRPCARRRRPRHAEAVLERSWRPWSAPRWVRGTIRILELRRAGVERSLTARAELGAEDGLALVRALRQEDSSIDDIDEAWGAEWERVGEAMTGAGCHVPAIDIPSVAPIGVDNPWSFTAYAVRVRGAIMLDAARAGQLRPVRRLLVAPGLMSGWGRTVAALLKPTDVFGSPESRAMMSYRALVECAAAEVDLLLQTHAADIDGLQARVEQITGVTPEEARTLVLNTAAAPFHALSAALAHEAWQAWYAEEGGDPAAFLHRAADGGGLAVPLARWALVAPHAEPAGPVTDGLI